MRQHLLWRRLSHLAVFGLIAFAISLSSIFLTSFSGASLRVHADPTYSAPITISDSNYGNGIFTGSWQSTDPNTPVILIQTAQPVTIIDSTVKGPGILIDTTNTSSHSVTVINTVGYGVNPNVAGVAKGAFLSVGLATKVVVENCDIENTGFGIFVNEYAGNNTVDQSIKILNNRFHNMDERLSNGSGGYEQTDNYAGHAVQLDDVHGVPGMEIAWNEFINEPYNSDVSDVVNIYLSSGTASSPLLIHDNYVQGAYAINPATQGFSGGGILLGDGDASSLSDAVGYVKAYNNQVISTSNYGLSAASGHDIEAYDNRVVSSGLLPDGTFIQAQNNPGYTTSAVGMYLDDFYSDIGKGTFFNNNFHDNLSGWVEKNGSGILGRNDYYLPNCETGGCTNNAPWPGTITPATEAGELAYWHNKVAAAHELIGPGNLVSNPSFESGLTDWGTWGSNVSVVDDPHSGISALTINGEGGLPQYLSGWQAGTTYELSGWAKSSTGDTVRIGVQVTAGGSTTTIPIDLNGATSYTYGQVAVPLPGNTTGVTVFVWHNGSSGTASFDDLALIPQPANTNNLVVNPGFEYGFIGWGTWGSDVNVVDNPHSGFSALTISGEGGLPQYLSGWTAGSTYTLSGWAQSSTGDTVRIGVQVTAGGSTTTIPIDLNGATSYTYGQVAVPLPGNTTGVTIFVWHNGSSGTASFDDLALTPAS